MSRLTIGALAERCGLSRSALRFYDECGLLRPALVDDATGYRYYDETQVETAETIRRLRAAEMRLDAVRRFLAADDEVRRELLDEHLAVLEQRLASARAEVVRLRVDQRAPGCALAAAALAAAIDQVVFATSGDASHPELGAILVELKDGSLRLVATDSYRLAVRDLVPDDASPHGAGRGLVATPAIIALRETLARGIECRLTFVASAIEIVVDGEAHELATVGGDFPDYESLLLALPPGERAAVLREELVSALESLDSASVTLGFGEGRVVVTGGEGAPEVAAQWSGPVVEVVLNRTFALEALAGQVGPDVSIEVVDPLRPVTFRSADAGTYGVLVMPIRV